MEDNGNQQVLPQDNAQIPPASTGFPIKKIISFVIGFVVLSAVIISIILFVLPRISQKKAEDVTLNYWIVFEDPGPYKEIAKEFTKQFPNIKVNIEKQDIKTLKRYIERLDARIGNGTGPDVFRYHASWLTELSALLVPLPQDVVESLELETKYFPVVKEDMNINGAYYGVPLHFDSLALFINTDLFKASGIPTYPKTWDDLASAANTLTVRDDQGKIITSGVAMGTYDNVAHASDIISLLMLQNGVDLRDMGGEGYKGNAIDVLEFFTLFAKGDTKVWDDTLENSKMAFASGKVAMYFGYSWDIFEIKLLNANLPFAVTVVPRVLNRNTTLASYWVEGVSGKTKHQEEAFEFLKFLSKKENLEKLYSIQAKTRPIGELYPRSDMAELLKDNTLAYPFVAQGPNAKSTLFSSDTYDDRMVDELNVYLGDAVRSVVNDNSSAESAIESLAAGVAQKLAQYEVQVK